MGKVHGSLARAGKVRSQTPKVRDQIYNFPNTPSSNTAWCSKDRESKKQRILHTTSHHIHAKGSVEEKY